MSHNVAFNKVWYLLNKKKKVELNGLIGSFAIISQFVCTLDLVDIWKVLENRVSHNSLNTLNQDDCIQSTGNWFIQFLDALVPETKDSDF